MNRHVANVLYHVHPEAVKLPQINQGHLYGVDHVRIRYSKSDCVEGYAMFYRSRQLHPGSLVTMHGDTPEVPGSNLGWQHLHGGHMNIRGWNNIGTAKCGDMKCCLETSFRKNIQGVLR